MGATWSRPHKGLHLESDTMEDFLDIDHIVDGGNGVSYAYSKFGLFRQSNPEGPWTRLSLKKFGIK